MSHSDSKHIIEPQRTQRSQRRNLSLCVLSGLCG